MDKDTTTSLANTAIAGAVFKVTQTLRLFSFSETVDVAGTDNIAAVKVRKLINRMGASVRIINEYHHYL